MDPNLDGRGYSSFFHLDDIRSHDIYTIDSDRNLQFAQFSPPSSPGNSPNIQSNQNKRQLIMDQSEVGQKRRKTGPVAEVPALSNIEENPVDKANEGNVGDDDSWVDLSKHVSPPPPVEEMSSMRIRFATEECLRLLREAQRESNSSSVNASQASSRVSRSPKSPPNSPNNEVTAESDTSFEELMHTINKEAEFIRKDGDTASDWIWDWSSRPYHTPPKKFRFVHPENAAGGHGASVRKVMLGNSSLFSKEVLYTMVITNVLSIIIGAGIGLWWSKRSSGTFIIGSIPID